MSISASTTFRPSLHKSMSTIISYDSYLTHDASSQAAARPIPLAAPVMSATRPEWMAAWLSSLTGDRTSSTGRRLIRVKTGDTCRAMVGGYGGQAETEGLKSQSQLQTSSSHVLTKSDTKSQSQASQLDVPFFVAISPHNAAICALPEFWGASGHKGIRTDEHFGRNLRLCAVTSDYVLTHINHI